MELKPLVTAAKLNGALCSNRTFMELKLANLVRVNDTGARSNRTFMELKPFVCIRIPDSTPNVLIVPLWN